MTFTPLFFLPHNARVWAFNQALNERLLDTPFMLLFVSVDKFGVWFWYCGDEVVWTWPWTRRKREGDNRSNAPFISLNFSGTGELGDAKYWSLKELKDDWERFFDALNRINPGDLVAFDDQGDVVKVNSTTAQKPVGIVTCHSEPFGETPVNLFTSQNPQ